MTIVDQPWLLGWKDDRLFMEAHTPLEDDTRDWPNVLPGLLKYEMIAAPGSVTGEPEPHRAHRITAESLGVPLPVLEGDTDISAYMEEAVLVNNIAVPPRTISEQVAKQDGD